MVGAGKPAAHRALLADRYGVIGHPVAHSRQPLIHGLFARLAGQELEYRLHDVAPPDFRRWAGEFFAAGGCGLSVIWPHKVAAAGFAHELTARASRAGGANLLTRRGERVLGDNTDGTGLVRDLTRNLGLTLAGCRVLVLGAGGSARGIVGPLLQSELAQLQIANRNPARAAALVESFADLGEIDAVDLDEVPSQPFDLVINATSAARAGTGLPQVAPGVIGPRTFCYDLSYASRDTPFTRWAAPEPEPGAQHNTPAKNKNGIEKEKGNK